MTNQEVFDAWAPPEAIWSPWVKPVLFSQMDTLARDESAATEMLNGANPKINFDRATAIVVDLPGNHGVRVALSLAGSGYRPVPLYNACPAPADETALVDVRPIMLALSDAVTTLVGLRLRSDAPPAFLLDANRNPAVQPLPGQFDNRSISLPTDFPSANFLSSHKIQRIVVVQSTRGEPQADLSHTLFRWQDAGLQILAQAMNEFGPPIAIAIGRPKGFRVLWYNLLAKLGLKANPLGGFGGRLPMPSSG